MMWHLSGGEVPLPLINKDRLWETYRVRNAASGLDYALGWHVSFSRGITWNCFGGSGHFD